MRSSSSDTKELYKIPGEYFEIIFDKTYFTSYVENC